MTGQLIYQEKTYSSVIPTLTSVIPAKAGIQKPGSRIKSGMTKNKHTHVIFYFSDGSGLLFNDLRQFGYLKLVQAEELEAFWEKEGLGPEALDKKFTFDRFKEILDKRPRVKIKQFLVDQKNIAGIGNIYADEILFFAGVHPLRQANSLSVRSAKDIFQGIKKILTLAIKLKGTSSSDYLDAHGQPGKFATQLKVYGRKGEKCVKCNGLIEKIKIVGRSASLCPICQPI